MALSVDVRATDGSLTGSVVLDEGVFGVQPNVPVMHQVVTAQLAAARSGTQSTKTRAEVSGGGAKPYKQKGTGRARQGSTNAPHYTGGGIALGPKPRNYRQHTPRKMVQLALRGALTDRASSGRVAVVDTWDWQQPSTKAARAALVALGISGRALIVLAREDQTARRSFRNLPEVDLTLAGELCAYDVLRSDWVVFSRETLPGVSGWAVTPEAQSAKPATSPAKAPRAAKRSAEAVKPAETGAGEAGEAAEVGEVGEGVDRAGAVQADKAPELAEDLSADVGDVAGAEESSVGDSEEEA
jgi:large subunit ribosomal protein L4